MTKEKKYCLFKCAKGKIVCCFYCEERDRCSNPSCTADRIVAESCPYLCNSKKERMIRKLMSEIR